ncbi:MAG: SpoIIIAH-like family protein [Eubacterium sp.]|nr:SpoIIIAH-like family protein [Eubacterium sp.]
MKFRKKELNNLSEAAEQPEMKSEAERAFEEAAAAVTASEQESGKKSLREARRALAAEDERLLEEKAEQETKHDPAVAATADFMKKSKVKRRRLAVAAFVLLLGVGIMGNWYFENSDFAGSVKPLITGSETKTLGEAEYVDATTAQPVNSENEYFSTARLERESARDEALEQLQAVVDSPDETAEAKQTATEAITRLSNYISVENKIETLIAAKGVQHCLAVVSADGVKVDIIVDAEELTDDLVLQIKEIAIQQLGCAFDAVTIINSN